MQAEHTPAVSFDNASSQRKDSNLDDEQKRRLQMISDKRIVNNNGTGQVMTVTEWTTAGADGGAPSKKDEDHVILAGQAEYKGKSSHEHKHGLLKLLRCNATHTNLTSMEVTEHELHFGGSRIPLKDVLNAEVITGESGNHLLKISYITRSTHISASLGRDSVPDISEVYFEFRNPLETEQWREQVMTIIYGPKENWRPRRIHIFVNPRSGKKKAKSIFDHKVVPILAASPFCKDPVIHYTERAGHCQEMVQALDLSGVDALVSVSGDGLMYELVNGLLSRPDLERAAKTPLGIVRAGTGNGLAHTIGCGDQIDGIMAIVHGQHRSLDVWSYWQKSKRAFSFLTIGWGIAGDINRKTNKLRWMGDKRFIWGAIQQLASLKSRPGRICFLPQEMKKVECKGAHCECNIPAAESAPNANSIFKDQEGVPKYDMRGVPGWKCIEDNFILILLANTPLLGKRFSAAPFSHLSDGLIDLIVIREVHRTSLMTIMPQFFTGDYVNHSDVEYYKVKGVTIEPLGDEHQDKGLLQIDGEEVDIAPHTAIEAHHGLVRVFCSFCVRFHEHLQHQTIYD